MKRDLVIIGGGPAGMSAAIAAYERGIRDILIIERDEALGGILRQCIHNGFGLHKFGEELTGPEYAARYEKRVIELGIPVMSETMVLGLTRDKCITATNRTLGIFKIQAKAVILAMGCRERSKGALNIPGSRPSGIYSAGCAQKLVNMKGFLPGREVVILGSGDIGLIMARRMTLEGAKVKAVLEVMPYSGGLIRNIEQCLNDFDIPLLLSHTVVRTHGEERLTGVTVAKVDERRNPIPGTEQYISCDTLLLSVGLIPENELTEMAGIDMDPITSGASIDQDRETDASGIFSCGNVLHVHDLVDFVSDEAEIAGRSAAEYIMGNQNKSLNVKVTAGNNVRYTVPEKISAAKDVKLFFRVGAPMKNVRIEVLADGKCVSSKKRVRVAPGEMESVALKSADFVNASEIRLEVVEL